MSANEAKATADGGAHVALSTFSSVLLERLAARLPDGGAVGRVTQVAVTKALERLHDGLLDHPGAGVPDVRYDAPDGDTWAWEIKYSANGKVELGSRDIEGVTAQGTAHPRFIVLVISMPAELWVLDGGRLEPGEFDVVHRGDAALPQEAAALAPELERVLLAADVDVLADEAEAKRVLTERADALKEGGA